MADLPEVVIQETKPVWVAWTNTDLTEGRGYQIPLVVCWSEATAIRLGKKKWVQGSDCPVEQHIAIKVNNRWLVPSVIQSETEEDAKTNLQLAASRAALKKAKDLGLSDGEISLLRSRTP